MIKKRCEEEEGKGLHRLAQAAEVTSVHGWLSH